MHASERGMGLICPQAQGAEAAWASGIELLAPRNILSLLNQFNGRAVLSAPACAKADAPERGPDLAQVKRQETAKRSGDRRRGGATC